MTDLSKLQYIREYEEWRKEKTCDTFAIIVGTLISFVMFGFTVAAMIMV